MLLKRFTFFLLLLVTASTCLAKPLSVADVVKLALEKNPVTREALHQLEAQKYREKYAFSQLFPNITFDYSYVHLKEEPYAKFHYKFSNLGLPFPVKIPSKTKIGEHQDVKWGIQATWQLFTGFYLSTLRKIEKIGIDAYRYKQEAVRLNIAHTARSAYYLVLIAQRNLETAEESVKQLKAHLRDATNFYKNGLVPYNDVLKAKVALAKAEEEKTQAEEALNTAWVNLNIVIRNPDPFERHSLKEQLAENIVKKLPDIKQLYKIALSHRPDILAVKKAVEQAKLGIRLAKSRYYPWITVFSRYEQHGDNILANNNDYSNRENFMIGAKINFLIFDFFGRRYKVHEARSTYLAWESKLEEVEDRAKLEVQKAYADLAVALRNIETAKAAVAHAKEDLRITRLQYSQQIASSSDVIDSEKAYIEAKNYYYNALFQYHIALSKLALACGLMNPDELFRGEAPKLWASSTQKEK